MVNNKSYQDQELLCANLLCYLSLEAKRVYSQLTENCNVDPDLAITLMERFFKDTDMFDLPIAEDLSDE